MYVWDELKSTWKRDSLLSPSVPFGPSLLRRTQDGHRRLRAAWLHDSRCLLFRLGVGGLANSTKTNTIQLIVDVDSDECSLTLTIRGFANGFEQVAALRPLRAERGKIVEATQPGQESPDHGSVPYVNVLKRSARYNLRL